MRWYYAQIDENNICIGISDLSGEVNGPDMIKIDNYNEALLGKKYNNDSWEDVAQPEKPKEPEPLSEQERTVFDTAINTEYLVCLADLGI